MRNYSRKDCFKGRFCEFVAFRRIHTLDSAKFRASLCEILRIYHLTLRQSTTKALTKHLQKYQKINHFFIDLRFFCVIRGNF
ncbi:hypothetical protein [Helicobacter sp. 23-1045]